MYTCNLVVVYLNISFKKIDMQEFHRKMDYIISCQFGMFAVGVAEM